MRTLAGYFASPALNPPALVKVGVFDALKLPGSTSLGRVPLGTFAFTPAQGAYAASRAILHDAPWLPATNLTGYLDSPPLTLTTLDAAGVFRDARVWSQPDYGGIVIPERPPLTDARCPRSGFGSRGCRASLRWTASGCAASPRTSPG